MNCYVMNPYDGADIPTGINKENTLFYPEARMTTEQQFKTSRPRDFHIVTDCIFLIPLYKREEVFIWRDGKWINPERQTYACSYSIIIDDIFGYNNTIPQSVIDGKTTNCMGSKT